MEQPNGINSDRGSPPRSTNATVQIKVNDNDDLPPKFTKGVYRTKINEFYPITLKTNHYNPKLITKLKITTTLKDTLQFSKPYFNFLYEGTLSTEALQNQGLDHGSIAVIGQLKTLIEWKKSMLSILKK
ncbi:hypothetical protein NQ318_017097 [Aromia moschata]|uniref:Cadherin domain-containing protein n=1 Tax=Aromia moschata TaxID=1265417 RepID=A0AAV8Y4E0_9CUCU|nr:hypothetical protein NQ318_017097 [Aromia moschata]